MKMIHAVIRPLQLEGVRQALTAAGVPHITVSEVKGYGYFKGKERAAKYRGPAYATDFVERIRIEVAIEDDALDRVIDAIVTSSRTGARGDGRIMVIDLEAAIRISTGVDGPEALR